MRFGNFLLCFSIALSTGPVLATPAETHLAIRQDSSAEPLPTLTSGSDNPAPESSAATSATTAASASQVTTSTSEPSSTLIPSGENRNATSTASQQPSTSVQDANTSAPTIPVNSGNSTNNSTAQSKPSEPLPLQPRITPALSVAGVFLILSGIIYALIGVKNQWIHVFLSTAYLASLAVLVLIVYVMNPPVSNAIQGAYFVGIFMSGLIFGGGALIFKEVTEGLGCLLGGFCLSMWFLTLKAGGLITNTGGKAIFISVFCVILWSFSFSHYTRAYGLMFSTSFAGSTSFVLGIDCFSGGGLKEFWVYIWDLNADIFPLNTHNYPITRGTRVQTIIIILGTIIGMISQLRLWKVVQDRQKERALAAEEDVRRRDAVEEALGRHLERQNDRDRSEWEKRYGDRLASKRETVLWSEAHGDKRLSSLSTTEVDSSQNSDSKESLEMVALPVTAAKPPLHSSKSKRQSNISVQAIPEVDEEDGRTPPARNSKYGSYTQGNKIGSLSPQPISEKFPSDHATSFPNESGQTTSKDGQKQLEVPSSLRPQNTKPASSKTSARLHLDPDDSRVKNRSSITSLNDLKRRSLQSLRSKSSGNGERTPREDEFSQSKEALVVPPASNGSHSRASSVAATMDEENEKLEMPVLEGNDFNRRDSRPPHIVISPSFGISFDDQIRAGLPPSPSGLSDHFDIDPEELVRPPAVKMNSFMDFEPSRSNRRTAGAGDEAVGGDIVRPDTSLSNASEGLTRGALERVPSQLSNVVLSYRTNEWAKHIATAEAPIFEEPDPVTASDAESPVHLAEPIVQEQKRPEVFEKPPPLPSPLTSVAPSEAGMKINPETRPAERPCISPTPEDVARIAASIASPAPESHPPSPNPNTGLPSPALEQSAQPSSQSIISNHRSFTDPSQTAAATTSNSRSARRVSNPMQRQPSILQSTPILENHASDFGTRFNGPQRTVSNATGYNSPYLQYSASAVDLGQQQQYYPSALQRGPSFTSQQNYSAFTGPSQTPEGSIYGGYMPTAMRSDTRLHDVGGNSHQPLQRNNTNESRRETLMADWRMQLANSHVTNVVPQTTIDNRYAQQRYDWESDKLRKEQERQNRARMEAAMDQSMRTQGMIDAHREVMKRMQDKANQKITK